MFCHDFPETSLMCFLVVNSGRLPGDFPMNSPFFPIFPFGPMAIFRESWEESSSRDVKHQPPLGHCKFSLCPLPEIEISHETTMVGDPALEITEVDGFIFWKVFGTVFRRSMENKGSHPHKTVNLAR